MFWEFLLFGVGLYILTRGSDLFVEVSAVIARKLGASEFLIGLTLVAFGTSVPELVASATASLKGESEIVVGNVVGSNIANIGLIVGIAAFGWGLKTGKGFGKKDIYMMVLACFIFLGFAMDSHIGFFEGLSLTLVYLIYLAQAFEVSPQKTVRDYLGKFASSFWGIRRLDLKTDWGYGLDWVRKLPMSKDNLLKDFLLAGASLILIFLGANLLIDSVVFFASEFGIPKALIGLSILAIGTSLPELSVSISASKKGHGEIVVGNVLGSNIANLLLVAGVSAVINPIDVGWLTRDLTGPVMAAYTLAFAYLIRKNGTITRSQGGLFGLSYLIFMAVITVVEFI